MMKAMTMSKLLKLTKQFQVNPGHRYNLESGTVVQSAKFGRTQVDIWQDSEPGPIWRGDPPVEVGRGSLRFWRFSVHGEMSGCATSERAAKAEGERRAWDSEANYRTSRGKNSDHVHALSAEEERAEKAAFAAWQADIHARFDA